jgi:hypothetical protein
MTRIIRASTRGQGAEVRRQVAAALDLERIPRTEQVRLLLRTSMSSSSTVDNDVEFRAIIAMAALAAVIEVTIWDSRRLERAHGLLLRNYEPIRGL